MKYYVWKADSNNLYLLDEDRAVIQILSVNKTSTVLKIGASPEFGWSEEYVKNHIFGPMEYDEAIEYACFILL